MRDIDIDFDDDTESYSSGEESGEDVVKRRKKPYIEVDSKIGLTANDTRLHKNDKVAVGVEVYIDVCRVW